MVTIEHDEEADEAGASGAWILDNVPRHAVRLLRGTGLRPW
jgi:hypothetical protein